MFAVNETVVYRKNLFRIAEIRNPNSKMDCMYLLVPYVDDGSLRIQVPAANKMGYLRKLSSREDIDRLIACFSDIPLLQGNNRMIENEYRLKMKNPSLEDLFCIIKTAYVRNQERLDQNKKASAVDISYFREAEQILYQEAAVSLNMTTEQAKEYILYGIEK